MTGVSANWDVHAIIGLCYQQLNTSAGLIVFQLLVFAL